MWAGPLPGNWQSTANALERLAFHAKDAVFAVDDFVAGAASGHRDKMAREADRLLRAAGNGTGRQRLTSDSRLMGTRPPRGLIVSTGEDSPPGESLRARTLFIEFNPGDMQWDAVTECQRDAAAGRYAALMAGYVRWLAPRYGEVLAGLRDERDGLAREFDLATRHRRTPRIVADLALGWRYLLRFFIEVGAISEQEALDQFDRCVQAIGEVAAAQDRLHAESEPAGRFLSLLASALAGGHCHLAGPRGQAPQSPEAWGWRSRDMAVGVEWTPCGKCVGWLDPAETAVGAYLDPDVAYAVVADLGRGTGSAPTVTPGTLKRRLKQQGYLAACDDARGRVTVRRKLAGQQREVVVLRPGVLFGEDQQQSRSDRKWTEWTVSEGRRASRIAEFSGEAAEDSPNDVEGGTSDDRPNRPFQPSQSTAEDDHPEETSP
jgi:hypothetical protein